MPIVNIEQIQHDLEPVDALTIQKLADELGTLFGSADQQTWVKLKYVSRDQYAENNVAPEARKKMAMPVLVEILKAELPPVYPDREARGVNEIVARLLRHPRENVHVLYQVSGRNRIAFGASLSS